MKRARLIVFAVLALSTTFTSCLKEAKCVYNDCDIVATNAEIQAVQNFLNTNAITATQHCSGLFYTLDNPGTGKSPGACSDVSVTYVGTLTNGTQFDASPNPPSPLSLNLGNVILGWRNGIPRLKEGGRIHLYIPPSLAYGNQQNGSIPPNSILVFDVSLVTVRD
jgi:FKBP-type peptidyl-prolyl cis-trans isomerase FkpA